MHVEDKVLKVLRKVCREYIGCDSEFTGNIFADGQYSLLPVEDFESAVFLINEIDGIERAVF